MQFRLLFLDLLNFWFHQETDIFELNLLSVYGLANRQGLLIESRFIISEASYY